MLIKAAYRGVGFSGRLAFPARSASLASRGYLLLPYLVAILLAGCARVEVVSAPSSAERITPLVPAVMELAHEESLEYQVSWWGVPVGTVVMTTSLAQPERNYKRKEKREDPQIPPALLKEKLLKLTLQGKSNPYLEAFYPVRIEIISFTEPESRSPRWFYASVRRRFRFHKSTITFDTKESTAFHQLPKGRSATVTIRPTTQDGLSILYYVRTLPLEVGQKIPLEITADGKNWQLTGKIVRTSLVEVKHQGKWRAIEGQAELSYPVPFFQGAKARIWFSADEERIPLLAKIHSRIGPVTVALTKRPNSKQKK